MPLWATYVSNREPTDENQEEEGNMIALPFNEFGEPIMPLSINRPEGYVKESNGKYQQKLVRTILSHNYGGCPAFLTGRVG